MPQNKILTSKNTEAKKRQKGARSRSLERRTKSLEIREADAKAAVLNYLRKTKAINSNAVIANELQISKTALRADLAIFTDQFIGIEIKTAADSLRRLTSQLDSYVKVFDRVIVVLATKHLKTAGAEILGKVEVWEITSSGTVVVRSNPVTHPSISLIKLMTQQEVKRFWRNPTEASSGRASEMSAFGEAFRHRFGNTSEKFWRAVGRKIVRPNHLSHLSRFRRRRQLIKKHQKSQSRFWQQWRAKAEAMFGAA